MSNSERPVSQYANGTRIAYAALPLVLHLLDVKLSSTAVRTAKKQRRLNIYIEAMKALQSQYDVTDTVSEIIGQMIEHVSLDQQEKQGETPSSHPEAGLDSVASNATDDPSVVQDWGDVLLRQPKLYLRLTVTMDLSMSKGSFPNDSDFPLSLQSKTKPGAQFPPYCIAMDDTRTSGCPKYELSNTRGFNEGMQGALDDIPNDSTKGPLDKSLAPTPNETMASVYMDTVNFDPSGFQLPMGFEAFDMELLSKSGFDFAFPWGTETTAFPESM